jgi:predicted Zn-ribbon and HTH transcriptional regulator
MVRSGFGNDNPIHRAFTKDDMKKTRRLSIEYRHREVTITVDGSTLHVEDGEPESAGVSSSCPTCGSPWIAVSTPADGSDPYRLDRIRQALQQSGLHLQVSPAGQLRICQRSFEEIKEKL